MQVAADYLDAMQCLHECELFCAEEAEHDACLHDDAVGWLFREAGHCSRRKTRQLLRRHIWRRTQTKAEQCNARTCDRGILLGDAPDALDNVKKSSWRQVTRQVY